MVVMQKRGGILEGRKYIFKAMKKLHYRCKGHNGFGMDGEARFGAFASRQCWQVLKTFKEVKTLFSVYKSSAF